MSNEFIAYPSDSLRRNIAFRLCPFRCVLCNMVQKHLKRGLDCHIIVTPGFLIGAQFQPGGGKSAVQGRFNDDCIERLGATVGQIPDQRLLRI